MKFVVAGGGVAGLASSLALARAGHQVVVLERDQMRVGDEPTAAFGAERRGIPHYFQPHAILPRGRRLLATLAPDILQTLMDAGAEPQDLADNLHGPRQPGDEDLVYLWVRRPIIEWALRHAAAAEPAIEIRSGVQVAGVATTSDRAEGVWLRHGDAVRGDLVVDALGRHHCPPGWPRPIGRPTHTGAAYFTRYYQLAEGVEHFRASLLNPRGDLGYLAFNVFRGDNRTYALILLVPAADHDLHMLRHDAAWRAACAAITPLNVLSSPDYGRPITDVMPFGGVMNVDLTGASTLRGFVGVGDALCHTDQAFAWGLSFAVVHGYSLADAAAEASDSDAIVERYRATVAPEARERHALACAIDEARNRRWAGQPLRMDRREGSYPLFSYFGALAAAPHEDTVLRRTICRIGMLDPTSVFDDDASLHARIEQILAAAGPPPPPGPPRIELVARMREAVSSEA